MVLPDPETLPWLRPHLERLERLFRGRRPPHAILLVGPRGIGKRPLAHAIAWRKLWRKEGRSGEFLQNGHSDLLEIAPEEGGMAIDQIRLATDWLRATSHSGRVLLLLESEKLLPAAANALLKTVEEPPQGALIILTVHDSPRKLPATLRSRCHPFRLPPPSVEETVTWLRARGVPDPVAQLAAVRYRGPLAAYRWVETGGLERRNRFWQDLSLWWQGERSLSEVSGAWEGAWGEVSFELLGWIRDLLAGEPRFHPDRPLLRCRSEKLGRAAFRILRALEESHHHLQRRLLLEEILLTLREACDENRADRHPLNH